MHEDIGGGDELLGKLLVKCDEDEEGCETHPSCPHGPTVLFYYENKGPQEGHYACSAYRDKKLCSFKVAAEDLSTKHFRKLYDPCTTQLRKIREKFLDDSFEPQNHYCLTCNVPLKQSDLQPHLDHDVKLNLSTQLLQNPTLFLSPMNNDKAQAQYFFDEKSLKFFENTFRDLKVSKVVCIGAPRLHAHLTNHCSNIISSYLLDFDHRFIYFYEDHQFAWFNMCNNHFFDDRQKYEFYRFLKCRSDDKVLLFTDPPFGCRTELIGNTLQKLTKLHNTINQLPHQPLPIFWIFPYFSAFYVQQALPALQMSDYKINYTNHCSYTDIGSKCRKFGSPVRLFTNVPLEVLRLPVREQYKYCTKCEKYTSLENRHCDKCRSCPSKNGSTYRHCNQCGLCVKPYYTHCHNCRRCCQSEGHNCLDYQSKQKCWICRDVGHTERRCEFWRRKCRNVLTGGNITCLLCNSKGHNELNCEKRSKYLKEFTFLGETRLCEHTS